MATVYYYFMAGLPSLRWGEDPPFSVTAYRDDCFRLLPLWDAENLVSLFQRQEIPSRPRHLWKQWRDFEHRLRNTWAWVRASEKNRDPLKAVRGLYFPEPEMMAVVSDALQASDPAEAEKVLDTYQWQKIDDLTRGHSFDFEAAFAYAVHLNILWRWKAVQGDEGRQTLEQWQEELKTIDWSEV